MAKNKNDEYAFVYYGIHNDTNEVVKVWVTRGNKLSFTMPISHNPISHTVMPGRTVAGELMVIYGITDTVPLGVAMDGSEAAAGIQARLQEKADQQKGMVVKPVNPNESDP